MLNRLKSKVFKSIKNKKLNVFGLFLLLTFAFLALTKLSKKYTEVIALDISYVNLPENRIISMDSLPKCNAVVSDYGFNLLTFHFKKQAISIDFEKDVIEKDSNYIWIVEKNRHKIKSQLGNSIEVVSLEHDTLKFPFKTLSIKKVPVVLISKIHFKSGYDVLDDYIIKPDSIKVYGSLADISNITSVETEPLDMNDVSDAFAKNIKLKKSKNNQIKYSDSKIHVSANVEKFTEGNLEVPISIINKPIDVTINYFPKAIMVFYNVSLNNYKAIKPIDFKVECDFSEIESNNKTYLTPKLVKVPDLVKNVRLKQHKVEFILIQ